MNAFQQYAKKLDANPNIPPAIALGFKFNFLDIELTSEQDKEFDDWVYASKANDRLFEQMLKFRVKLHDKPLSLEQQIQEVAAYATFTPRAIELLDNFLQDKATAEDRNEIDEWLHESAANDLMLDLLLQLDHRNPPGETISLLRSLVSKAEKGVFTV
jgi:hypothetical protein